MARPVAGLRKKTLILTLPGSPKGAKENLEAVLKLLPHACIQAAGAESRPLHAGGVEKLEKDAGVSSAGTTTGMRHAIYPSNTVDNKNRNRMWASPSWSFSWSWWTRRT
jgi:hypothetical protein